MKKKSFWGILKLILLMVFIGIVTKFLVDKFNIAEKILQYLGLLQQDEKYFNFGISIINIILSILGYIVIPITIGFLTLRTKEIEKPHIKISVRDVSVIRKKIKKDGIKDIVIGDRNFIWFVYVDVIVENTGQNALDVLMVNGETLEIGSMNTCDKCTFRFQIYRENDGVFEDYYNIKFEYTDILKNSYQEEMKLKIDEQESKADFEIGKRKRKRRRFNWI